LGVPGSAGSQGRASPGPRVRFPRTLVTDEPNLFSRHLSWEDVDEGARFGTLGLGAKQRA